MIRPKKYLPVRNKFFFAPLIKENLRLDFSSSENKLNDLPLLIILMLREGKTSADIAAATLLPPAVIEDVLAELKSQGLSDARNEQTKKICRLSDCINDFNLNAPPIFTDTLTKSLVMLSKFAWLGKSFDDTNCAAVVKNSEQIFIADFEDISNLVKKYLIKRGASEFIDELKLLRLNQLTEIFFAVREIKYLPVVGEDNFAGCVNFDSARLINAELPVRKFRAATAMGEWIFYVDLLLGTMFKADDEESDSEEAVLSFKPSAEFEGDVLNAGILKVFDSVEDLGMHYVKISVAENILGDFL